MEMVIEVVFEFFSIKRNFWLIIKMEPVEVVLETCTRNF